MRGRGVLPGVAVAAGVIAVTLLVVNVVIGWAWSPGGDEQLGKLWSLAWVGFPIVGAVIAAKRPGTRIGWLLLGAGLAIAVALVSMTWALRALHTDPGSLPGGEIAVLLTGLETTAFVLLAFALLHFPRDQLPSRRWRWPALIAAVLHVTAVIAGFLTHRASLYVGERETIWVEIPFAHPRIGPIADHVTWIAGTAAGTFAVVVLVSLVVRALRSEGIERQQMKWIGYFSAIFAGFLTLIPLTFVGLLALSPMSETILAVSAFVLCFNGFAAAIGVAVLRYRLYDIDRVASRTVTYAVVSLVLLGAYALGVLGIGRLVQAVTGQTGSDLVVAASTLAVAALFGPVRRRVQWVVDRRFNRSGFDASRTVERFAHTLRDEVDLRALTEQLRSVALETVQPASAAVWVRDDRSVASS